MRCKFIKPDGSQCQAIPNKTSGFCFRHDPQNKEKAKFASQKGGENRKTQGKFGKKVILDKPEDIRNFLGLVISSVWTGKIPTHVGSSMGFLSRCWLDAYEKVEIEKRISVLEDKMGTNEGFKF